MGPVPSDSGFRLFPELQQLSQEWSSGASIENVLSGFIRIDKSVVYVSQQPVGGELDATVTSSR